MPVDFCTLILAMNELLTTQTQKRADLRIVFMGTPEFAVGSLEALLTAGFRVVGVVTAPDKPAGRGLKLQESAVKKYAISKAIPVLQPEKLKNAEFLETLRSYQADIQVVVAFRMLPEAVWKMPPLGTINLHASLLPQYRGAAPINWAIINGEKETGVTTFRMQQQIDTGNILLQEKVPIGDQVTAGELHDILKIKGASLLVKTLEGIQAGTLPEISQSGMVPETDPELKTAPKIFSENCRINWDTATDEIYNLIRGLSPFPVAFTYLNNQLLKIYAAEKEATPPDRAPGSLVTDGKTYLKFTTRDGFLQVTDLQLEGKKRMLVKEFLKGFRQA